MTEMIHPTRTAPKRRGLPIASMGGLSMGIGDLQFAEGLLSVVRCPLSVATDDGQRTTDREWFYFCGWGSYAFVVIVLIDNYDSFTYNLVQRLGEIDPQRPMKVFRHDKVTIPEIEDLRPTPIVISPSPCTPK